MLTSFSVPVSPSESDPIVLDRRQRLYFANSVGSITEHPDGYAIVRYNAGPRQLDHLQAFLAHASQLLRSRNWHKMLGDQRLMSPYTPEEQAWIVDYWLMRQQTEGRAVYGAVVVPHDVFARLSLSQMMHEAQAAALTYRLFDEEEVAIAWLRQLD
ncbi:MULTISPECIES: hypothetical protein [Hymenobacter]|uniref:STAS/SEC14 domain-containing protein n=1 Tax=Hymenobacter jejuensis TaxID=2502781 RepID=A0A5B8A4M9_9BACT|nr:MULTISPECIES: hypothetical protein [Hymenobacter]MBC6989565.1 hypothetical protein [Hymenobacter sp. BT491]QDA61583.1 hypothetical protein FHG12_16420 [Hymenobacter jejuensis]